MSANSRSNSSFLILALKTLSFLSGMLGFLSLSCDYASKKWSELEDSMVRCFQPMSTLSLKEFALCLGTAQFKKCVDCDRQHIQTCLGCIFLSSWAKVKVLKKEFREALVLSLRSSLGLGPRQPSNTALRVHTTDGWQVRSWEGALRSLAIHRCPIVLVCKWIFLGLLATL